MSWTLKNVNQEKLDNKLVQERKSARVKQNKLYDNRY